MSPEVPRGRCVWHELMTTDPAATQSFYTRLTGWSAQMWDGRPTPYTMWMNGDTAVGGLMQLLDEAKQQGAYPHWLAYIATPDVDVTTADVAARWGRLPGPPAWRPYLSVDNVDDRVQTVKQLGGQVLDGPMDVPGGDRVAPCLDTQGAAFATCSTATISG